MPATDRTGQTFGKLTVTADHGGAQLQCRCECGREGSYPRAITKPSYRGPKACPWCLGSPCEECGAIIPHKGRMPAKTCSEACCSARAARRERERYDQIKGTDEFKAKRADYLRRLDAAMAADPDLAESVRETRRRAVRAWRDRQLADPVLRGKYRMRARQSEQRRLERIRSDPDAYAEHLRKQRAWYHSLSDDEYQRIFAEGRKEREMRESSTPQERPQSQREWTDDEIAMLGTDTDQAVADILGRPRNSVKNKRTYMKIPTKSRFRRWKEWEREALGTDTDAAVAEMLGRPLIQVTAQRQQLQIPAVLDVRNCHGPRKHAIPDHILERLGKASDVELAKEAGVTWHTIRARRLERGIPAFQPKE